MAPYAPDKLTSLQIAATVLTGGILVVSGVAVIQFVLPAILWAGVLAVALWPTYTRVTDWHTNASWQRISAPLLVTIGVGLVIGVPVALGAIELGHAVRGFIHWVSISRRSGVPVPAIVAHIPFAGTTITGWWQANLAQPNAPADILGQISPGQLAGWTRSVGVEIVHRMVLFFFTLITLFFLFRDGHFFYIRLLTLGDSVFGPRSERIANHAIDAIHSTVDGLVLVGLAEGAVIGIGYWLAGVPHPFLFAIATGILAMIPFGAPLAFCIAASFLLVQGDTVAAIILVIYGFVVTLLADHIVRPVLIGGSARLPFLLVLLGIFGGLASLGLIGLFIGPALMAVVVSLWREFTDPVET